MVQVYCSEEQVGNALDNVAILSDDITRGITDASIGVGLLMHREAQVPRPIQVGGGFGFGECRALDGVGLIDHTDIISTGWAVQGSRVDTSSTVTPRPNSALYRATMNSRSFVL